MHIYLFVTPIVLIVTISNHFTLQHIQSVWILRAYTSASVLFKAKYYGEPVLYVLLHPL